MEAVPKGAAFFPVAILALYAVWSFVWWWWWEQGARRNSCLSVIAWMNRSMTVAVAVAVGEVWSWGGGSQDKSAVRL